jgi:hypothetical protein
MFSARSMLQLLDATIELLEAVFSMWSLPRCYKQDELVDKLSLVQCTEAVVVLSL